jgi:hypothetical protein
LTTVSKDRLVNRPVTLNSKKERNVIYPTLFVSELWEVNKASREIGADLNFI